MIIDEINSHRIILASRSPRRQQLLKELGLNFEVIIKEWDEEFPGKLRGHEIALYLAERKAGFFKDELTDNEIVITADTIVWCNNKVLGKPVDAPDAKRILQEVSGNTHEVITGVCLLSVSRKASFYSSTRVHFENLTEEEIEFYVLNYRPYDKAGAYGIQEWIGLAACSNLEGSYFNVMGLPVQQVYSELRSFIT